MASYNRNKYFFAQGLGKGIVDRVGTVRLGKFRLVLIAIKSNEVLNATI